MLDGVALSAWNTQYCKDIKERAKSMQDNINNFDKDIQKEKDNSRSL